MDSELLRTCEKGDVEKLKELFETRSHEFFLAQDNESKNMLHILSRSGKLACAKEALGRLPDDVVCKLTRQPDSNGNNPLQVAVTEGQDEMAEFLISVDTDFLRKVDNADSLLRQAVTLKSSCKRTAEVILRDYEYSVKDFGPSEIKTLGDNCSEDHAVLLLEKHPEVFECQDSSGKMTILKGAIIRNWKYIIETILNIDPSVSYIPLNGEDLLHIAVKDLWRSDIAKIIVDAFNKYLKRHVDGDKEAAAQGSNSESPLPVPLWRQTEHGNILHMALKNRDLEVAARLLSSDFYFLSCLADSDENAEISLVKELEDSKEVAEASSPSDVRSGLKEVYLETFLQFIRDNRVVLGDATKKLIKQHPELVQFKDDSGRAILQYALDENDVDTMGLILEVQPSAVNIQDDKQEHLLIKACKKGNLSAIEAICHFCPEVDARGENQTTPLHHVKLQSKEDYGKLLDIKAIARLKNMTDADGRTPLIKAILDNDSLLVDTLLDKKGIDVMTIEPNKGQTAAALLKAKCKEFPEWVKLYEKATELLTTKYIPLGADLKEIRNTFSVVAALLITITFGAGFTVINHFDQNNGDVLGRRKPAFIIFVLSDTYAMCCSIIVLYSLIWAAVQEPDMALKLIDYSVDLLRQSFYGALLAFMTGAYTMLSSNSIWVAIIVLVMCSTIMISVYIIFRIKFVHRFLVDRFIDATESLA